MILHKTQIQEHPSIYDEGEVKTVFQLGIIDHTLLARIIDANIEVKQDSESEGGNKKTVFHNDERNILFVESGLKGWREFKDDNGNEIPIEIEERLILGIKTKALKKECLARLPYKVVQELGMAIRNINLIGEIERKNS